MRPDAVHDSNFDNSLDQSGWAFLSLGGSQGFCMGVLPGSLSDVSGSAVSIPVGQPLLHGPGIEFLSFGSAKPRWSGPLCLFEKGGHLAGFVRMPADASTMEETAHSAYLKVIKAVGSRSFCRLWNYVPQINFTAPEKLENYKLFCIGRNKAFAEIYGVNNNEPFSAASATGSIDNHLTVVFFSTDSPVRNWENPEQTPAYEYPPQYGPRPPSFARASMCGNHEEGELIFISGTAAIKGHETQFPGDFQRQLETTLNNIDLTLAEAGLRMGKFEKGRRAHFKVFLRDRANLDCLLQRIQSLLNPPDTCMVVEAEICRSDLEVEIELTVMPDR